MVNPQIEDTNLHLIFHDPEYSYQSLRTLAATAVGAADIGECLVTFKAIQEGNDESWYSQWIQLAQRVEKGAMQSQKEGHIESATSAFCRASNYYRTAEFFLHINPQDPRILDTWRKSRNCFREAIKGCQHPIQEVKIPFEKTHLPGYLCLVDKRGQPRPLLIAQTGFDGTAEEVYFVVGKEALKRGYNCLIFEGPGQGAVIREQGIPFRPNWETVVTPVVDFALSLKEVKPNQIALLGISMGGYLVPRALAFEHRVKIGIANGGVLDFHEVCMQAGPPELEGLLDDPQAAEEVDQFIYKEMKHNPFVRWALGQGMYAFHASSPSEWLKMTRPYTLKDVVKQISCLMLVVESDADFMMQGQSKQLFDALQGPKDFILFTAQEGAGEHCQVGAYDLSNERIFNWLDSHLIEK